LIRNLLHAFSELHACGIVHGDIHSSNVLAARNKTVRIIDLGLSVKKEELSGDQILKYGGVDFYMPPERINTSSANKLVKPPDFYSDVYQIGLLLYSILYHELPFRGFTWEELATHIKEDEAPFHPFAAGAFSVPLELNNIIRKSLEKKPENRQKDATEMLEEYNEFTSKTQLQIDL
jgi:serine/threonine protein kinase